ncbi:MAG: hypothetical protein CSYNP_00115 [Syntrophus sp. SKADARSKE-3]|nr:hypothetical protein [Syntrophus sp. SKADARSKE-3]
MKGLNLRQQQFIEICKREYGDRYDRLHWISEAEASRATEERNHLMAWLNNHGINTTCHQTKPHCHTLSPGCRSCTLGEWSCLFINGICNGRCFFCPTDQSDLSDPVTQSIQFNEPQDYVDYLDLFQFKGVSLSGGEPLMSIERTISFISAVKKRFGASMHLWMYTNGKLVTPEILRALQKAGLDEIRFNIYASHDFLEKIRSAAGLIRYVTVEIPAIPEGIESLKQMLAPLKNHGVQFLNLHQLRLTPHNYPHLAKRNYSYIHGPKATVPESELTALKVMKYNMEEGINLPINYCSFVYKNTFQRLAERRRHARYIMKPHESLTEAGMIRSLQLKGHPEKIRRQIKTLQDRNIHEGAWNLREGEGLFFHPSCWPDVDFKDCSLVAHYCDTAIRSSVSYQNMFKKIQISTQKKVVIERWSVSREKELHHADIFRFGRRYLGYSVEDETTYRQGGRESARNEQPSLWDDLDQVEQIPEGLATYY